MSLNIAPYFRSDADAFGDVDAAEDFGADLDRLDRLERLIQRYSRRYIAARYTKPATVYVPLGRFVERLRRRRENLAVGYDIAYVRRCERRAHLPLLCL